MYFLGVDLGTSAVKVLLVDKEGNILFVEKEEYPLHLFASNHSEQNPSDWLKGVFACIKRITSKVDDVNKIKGISFAGQMHGLVVLDKNDEVIRPCILWNDGRTDKETDYLNNVIGKKTLIDLTGNIAFAGFTLSKILWLKNNEPMNFKRIDKIMLPKDYLAYVFSNVFATDYSDASGTLLLDVKNKVWSKQMCDIACIKETQLPKLYESYEVIGVINKKLANELNLPTDLKVIIGAGDNAASAIGTGSIANNDVTISLGTSGTIFISSDNFISSYDSVIHSFAHASGKYHLMGCILSASSCSKWWVENILKSSFENENDDYDNLIANNSVIFLPYLMGERCPHNDTSAKGAFIGMRLNTTREEMHLAILEGITFALKDNLEIALKGGLNVKRAVLCGGGSKSKGMKQIVANILNIEIDTLLSEQGPGYGAAILAMVGTNAYKDINTAVNKIVKISSTIKPIPSYVEHYKKKYQIFKKLYIDLKDTFKEW